MSLFLTFFLFFSLNHSLLFSHLVVQLTMKIPPHPQYLFAHIGISTSANRSYIASRFILVGVINNVMNILPILRHP